MHTCQQLCYFRNISFQKQGFQSAKSRLYFILSLQAFTYFQNASELVQITVAFYGLLFWGSVWIRAVPLSSLCDGQLLAIREQDDSAQLGVDLEDPETRLRLLLSFKVMDLMLCNDMILCHPDSTGRT